MRRPLICSVAVLFAVCLLTGCLCPSIKAPSVILTDACTPPCWNGITPGVSGYQEVDSVLRTLSEVDVESIRVGRDNDTTKVVAVTWNFTTTVETRQLAAKGWGGSSGAVRIKDGRASQIDLALPHASGLSLATAIQRWGAPAKILVCRPGGEFADYIKLVYPSQGVILGVYNNCPNQWSGNTVTVNPDFQVTQVIFFDPRNYEDLLGTQVIDGAQLNVRSPETRLQRINEHLQDWAGFARNYVSQGECWKWSGDY